MEDNVGQPPVQENGDLNGAALQIDIREVIRSKNERLARLLPGFVIRYLKRILHVDEINAFLRDNKDKYGLDFVDEVIRFFNIKITVRGLEKIPAEGKVTLVSNHPLGGLDGIAILHTIGRVRKDILVPANDLLLFLPNIRPMFIPINKHGKNTENVAIINETFAAENIIPYFPAGLCSRKQSGVIKDVEWKPTFISKSKRNQRVVVPVHFSGRNSSFFYNLAHIRKFFRIKANIEMFFLVNEMFKQYDREFVITIGDPIPYTTFDGSRKPDEWAGWVRDKVYELEGQK